MLCIFSDWDKEIFKALGPQNTTALTHGCKILPTSCSISPSPLPPGSRCQPMIKCEGTCPSDTIRASPTKNHLVNNYSEWNTTQNISIKGENHITSIELTSNHMHLEKFPGGGSLPLSHQCQPASTRMEMSSITSAAAETILRMMIIVIIITHCLLSVHSALTSPTEWSLTLHLTRMTT